MPRLSVPRLFKNRCGVYCFRLKEDGRDRRISLRTKCPMSAAILAYDLNSQVEKRRAMKHPNPNIADLGLDIDQLGKGQGREYLADLRQGIIRADSPDDHARLMEVLTKIGPLLAIGAAAPAPPSPAPVIKSKSLDEVKVLWLAQCKIKNQPRTVYAKERHFEDFASSISSSKVEINGIVKATMVAYKTALINDGQKAKTIDNKLMSLHDYFKFALTNGHYTVSNENPVAGLFLLTQTERVKQNDPFIPFEPGELTAFFEPAGYIQQMATPDLFWAPLLGIYTGMRISEATQIRAHEVKLADNGVHYIFVPKSKTCAGVRNVPIPQALLDLGFLDYIEEVRAGVGPKGRLFPHCLWINGTYSKDLSKMMLDRMKALDIRETGDGLHKSFHSFRVNVITALANAGANTPQTMRIVGHQDVPGAANIKIHMGYVRELPDLKAIVERLQWPIQLGALIYDGRWKNFLADEKNHMPDGDLEEQKKTRKPKVNKSSKPKKKSADPASA